MRGPHKTDRVIYLDDTNRPRSIAWDDQRAPRVSLPARDPWAIARGQWSVLAPVMACSGYGYGLGAALLVAAVGSCWVAMQLLWSTRK